MSDKSSVSADLLESVKNVMASSLKKRGNIPCCYIPSKFAEEQIFIGNYHVLSTIGEGSFGRVQMAYHVDTYQEVAIKIIQKSRMKDESKLYREIRIMSILNHTNIVKFYEFLDTEEAIYLIMEYAAGGDLNDHLARYGKMSEGEARTTFRQVVTAVLYCHQMGIIHRDIKPQNIVLDSQGNAKLADFGLANAFVPGEKFTKFCGTISYAAPEVIMKKEHSGPETDIWSLGVLLYKMATNCKPFDGVNILEVKLNILKGEYVIPPYISKRCHYIIKQFLCLNPSDRCKLENILKDEWMNQQHEDSEPGSHIRPLSPDKKLRKTDVPAKAYTETSDSCTDSDVQPPSKKLKLSSGFVGKSKSPCCAVTDDNRRELELQDKPAISDSCPTTDGTELPITPSCAAVVCDQEFNNKNAESDKQNCAPPSLEDAVDVERPSTSHPVQLTTSLKAKGKSIGRCIWTNLKKVFFSRSISLKKHQG